MRARLATFLAIATVSTALAVPASAQQADVQPPGRITGSVDFGVRFTDVSGDAAKWQRYRDLGDGFYVQSLKLDRSGPTWNFQAAGVNMGRDDQRFTLTYRNRERVKVSFVWDEIPLFISDSTATLYTGLGSGTLRIADGIQSSTQTSSANLSSFIGGAQRFDLESRRRVARLDVIFRPNPRVDLLFNVRNTIREGTQPYGAYNLQPIEVPLPVDSRTTDVGSSLQWNDGRNRLSIGYQGSWFDNRVPTFIWDSPFRLNDSATAGAGQGRMALWPDNTLQAVTASGATKFAQRTNLTASVTFGRASQDQTLLPFTINSQIAAPALPRQTADALVRNTAANVSLTSRPHPWVWLSARWRYYDSNNRMPNFEGVDYIRADQRVSTFAEFISTAPLSFSRNTLDLDLSLTPRAFAALRVGYTRNGSTWENRIFSEATEDIVRASLDTTTLDWLTFRGTVERSSRTGSGFRPELLEAFEEQPTMRHFDIADRDRTRYTALIMVTPGSVVGASASISHSRDQYDDAVLGSSGFGLKDYKNRRYSASIDVTPTELVSMAVWWSREQYEAFQRSRTASPTQFDDPQRDWMLDTDDHVDTISAELAVRQLWSKCDVRFAYQTSRQRADYVHSALNPAVIGAVEILPSIRNTLDTGTLDVSWPLTDRLALGVMYRYDRYDVRDFLLDESALTSLNMSGGMFLGYLYRPYTANGVWLRLNYRW